MRYLSFLLCLSAFGQTTLYVPTGTTRCISAATNATPIVITTAGCDFTSLSTATPTAVAHGWSNGQVVVLAGVEGNTAANGTRIVQNVTSTTAELTTLAGAPVAGNGAFARYIKAPGSSFPEVAAASLVTLRDHPRVWLDGPLGTFTSTLCAGGSPCIANTSNVMYDGMKISVDSYFLPRTKNPPEQLLINQMQLGQYGMLSGAAFIYQATGDTTYRDAVLAVLNNIEKYWHWYGCVEAINGCADKTKLDVLSSYYINIAQAYSIVRASMTSGERAAFAGKMLNGGTMEDTCTNRFVQGVGSISGPLNSTLTGTFTGTGTLWLTDPDPAKRIAPGDTITFTLGCTTGFCDGMLGTVATVPSDTSLTFQSFPSGGSLASASVTSVSNGPYWIGKSWTTGMCGYTHFLNHSGYSEIPSGKLFPSAANSSYGGLVVYTQDPLSRGDLYNQNISKGLGFLTMALALADDDARAISIIQRLMFWWKDTWNPLNAAWTTGPMQISSKYYANRNLPLSIDFAVALKRSVASGLTDYTTQNWLKVGLPWIVHGYSKAYQGYTRVFDSYPSYYDAQRWRGVLAAGSLQAGSDLDKANNYIIRNWAPGFNSAAVRSSNLIAYPELFLFYNPWATATDPNTTLPFAANLTVSDSQSNGEGTGVVMSRTGWTDAASILEIHALGVFKAVDTWGAAFAGNPGSYKIFKRNYLFAEDSGTGTAPATANAYCGNNENSAYMRIGPYTATSPSLLNKANSFDDKQYVRTPRFWNDSGNAATYAMVDYAGAYQSAAHITFAHRHFAHFKKAGASEYVIAADSVRTSDGKHKVTFLQYPNNGQAVAGQPTEGVTTVSGDTITSSSPTSRIISNVLKPGGTNSLRVYTDNPDGSYTGATSAAVGAMGGKGQTFRVSVCASTDGSTCDTGNLKTNVLVAHRIVDGTAETSNPATLLSTIDSNFFGVQADDGTSAVVAVFPSEGATLSAATFTSTHANTGQYLVSGLTTGTWSLSRGGSIVNSSVAVDSSGTMYWEGVAGAYSLSRTGAGALSVATTTVPSAAPGEAYSVPLSATGGTPPYTWAVSAGALPSGITLSSGGLISGSTLATGTFSFTAQATDSASATATQALSLTVAAPALSVTTSSLASGATGVAYSASLAATGGTPLYTWSIVSGTLCTGLSLSGSTISGTPSAAGTCSFRVQVQDAASVTATKDLTITISGTVALSITTATLPSGTVNTSYSSTLAATGGTSPYAWSVASGTLPDGLTLSAGGVLSGSPLTDGIFSFTIAATDAVAAVATAPFSVTIAPRPTGNITVSATGAAASALIRYTSTGVPWNQICTVSLIKDGVVVWTRPDSGGRMPRTIAAAGLDAGVYNVSSDCSIAEIGTGTATVTVAPSGLPTSSLKVGGSANNLRGAVKMRAEWGYTSDVTGTPVTVACTGVGIQQCMATITGINAGSVVFVRLSYLDSSDAVVATGEAVPVTVQ